ncbi:hypothetical protein BDR05DRAFT_986004 [Suillus weaverae]|nr:hypothetical protein BDR05DRAFT_986004 [Suillus weaverae]
MSYSITEMSPSTSNLLLIHAHLLTSRSSVPHAFVVSALPRVKDSELSESIVDCGIARDTDAGRPRTSRQCPVSHPDQAAALSNLACALVEGYTQNHLQNIDSRRFATQCLGAPRLSYREQPYNSRFAMRHKSLALLDIMENDTPHAEFEFLSETPDEFSGFKSVIGTLWVVDDAVAKHVETFYENMFKNFEDGGVMKCTKAA